VSDQILDVDLLAFETGDGGARRAVVDGVMRSLASGFVYTSQDVSDGLLDDAYGKLAAFFALPADVKSRSVAPGTHGQTGYTGLLVETAAVADVPDWKEMLNWGRAVPEGHPLRRKYPHRYHEPVLPDDDVPGIRDVLLDLHDRLLELQRRFLRIVAVGLGCHETFFDRLLVDGPTLSRAIHYPAMSSAPAAGHVWAGEHADINLITALPRATERGLQIRTADGDWVDAAPPAGHAIVNTGMMLERMSNGRIPAGWHRVVADPSFTGDRLSVVQFCHPTPWTVLTPVASSVDADHPQRFAPIEAGDLLDQVLYEINLVEDAPRVGASPS
jgi:isopenicillin N synthase-like dioxygenase